MITVELELDTILDGMLPDEHSELLIELQEQHNIAWILEEMNADMDDVLCTYDKDEIVEWAEENCDIEVTDTRSIDEQMDDLYFKLDAEQKKILLLRAIKDLL